MAKLYFFLARGYLRFFKAPMMLRYLMVIGVLGVALSSASYLIIQSILDGFRSEITHKITGVAGHLNIQGLENYPKGQVGQWLDKNQAVLSWDHRVRFEGMLDTTTQKKYAVFVVAVVNRFSEQMKQIDFLVLNEVKKESHAFLGFGLSETLSTEIFFEDTDLRMINPIADISPIGEFEPFVAAVDYAGIFKSKTPLDDQTVLLFIEREHPLLPVNRQYDSYHVRLKHPDDLTAFSQNLLAQFRKLEVFPWQKTHARIFEAQKFEKKLSFLLIAFVLLMSLVNIVTLMALIYFSKHKEWVILHALGFSFNKLGRVLLLVGLILALMGAVLGVFLGWLVLFILQRIDINLPHAYFFDHLPIEMGLGTFFVAFSMAPALILLLVGVYFLFMRKPSQRSHLNFQY